MNKIQIIIDSILAAAVVALFVLVFTLRPAASVPSEENAAVALSEQLPVAYINLDSLLVEYTFAQEASERLMSKQEDARLKLNSRARTLQQEMADFQRKVENNAFLSRERAEQEQQRLLKKQQDLQDLEDKLTQDIMLEQQQINLQLRDTLNLYLQQYNADKKYQIIFANTQSDNVLIAQPGYDITAEVIEALNKRYAKK
ncbi:MAG: OmpH family outer membrane protein [Paludibacteraceae bacterium]|nr:OmpH family outer membrane protein [Paludibacteraceae bacterium]